MKKLKKILMLPFLLTHHSEGFGMETEKELVYSRKPVCPKMSPQDEATFNHLQNLFSQKLSQETLQKPVDDFQMAVHAILPKDQYDPLLGYAKTMQQSLLGAKKIELPDLLADIKKVMKQRSGGNPYASTVLKQWTNTASKSIIDRFNAAQDKLAALETLGAYKAVSDSYNCFAACTNWNAAQNKKEKSFYRSLTVLAYKHLLQNLGLSSLEGPMDWRAVVAPAKPATHVSPVASQMEGLSAADYLQSAVKIFEPSFKMNSTAQNTDPLLKFHLNVHNLSPEILKGIIDSIAGASFEQLAGTVAIYLESISLQKKVELFQNWANTQPRERKTDLVRAFQPNSPQAFFKLAEQSSVYKDIMHSIYARVAHGQWKNNPHSQEAQALLVAHYSLGRVPVPRPVDVLPAVSQQQDPLRLAIFHKPFQKQLNAFKKSVMQLTAHDPQKKIAALYGEISSGIDQRVQEFVQQMDWDKLEGWRPGSDKPQITQLLVQLSDEIKHQTPFGAEIDQTLIPDLKKLLQRHPARSSMEQAWIETFSPKSMAALYKAQQTAQWEETKTQMKMYEAMLDSMSLNLCFNAVNEIERMLQTTHLGFPVGKLSPEEESAVRLNLLQKKVVYQAFVNLFQGVYVPMRFDVANWFK